MVMEEMSTCDKDEGVKRSMRRVKETEREGVKGRERVNQGAWRSQPRIDSRA